ncbi:hypothetical protein [Aminobacter niigataensis]|uniref:hypothetical protein n=1 Tax=Aminobacter niigataensis TaxID=83265 RepID=UPI00298F22D0|nr:hypothetical protein [Aminobacter niigataensis]
MFFSDVGDEAQQALWRLRQLLSLCVLKIGSDLSVSNENAKNKPILISRCATMSSQFGRLAILTLAARRDTMRERPPRNLPEKKSGNFRLLLQACYASAKALVRKPRVADAVGCVSGERKGLSGLAQGSAGASGD